MNSVYNMNVDTKEAYELVHNGILALSRAEQVGLRINRKYVHRVEQQLTKEIQILEDEFKDTKLFRHWKRHFKNKVNIYSPQQLGIYLYKVRKLKPPKETKGGSGSTDEESLGQLNLPELDILLKIKKLKKTRDTYLSSFSREQIRGVIHPFFNLHLVTSYRSSSNNPNFQNIPKRDVETMNLVRRAIYPRKGYQLLELDYSQLEVRVATCYHQDPTMMKYIETGHDMHKDIAVQIFKINEFSKEDTSHKILRAAAKNGFVFPQFYGSYYKSCAIGLATSWGELSKGKKWTKEEGIPFEDIRLGEHLIKHKLGSLYKFEEHIRKIESDFWNNRFPIYAEWKDKWYAEYEKHGFAWSKTGFTYQGNMSRNEIINYPIQGSAFHILLWSLTEATKAFRTERMKTRIVGQIHDAIVLDVYPPELNKVINIMKCIMCNDVRQHWKWITTPLEIEAELCDVNKSWATKKEYKIN